MALALYRKYRPKSLSDVVGQEHITKTLENALKTGAISHAYLFTGPRGVGKTSIARILAHEINGLPYDEDATHLDIIEIDAASNRRIDEIRDLRDKVHIAPSSAAYKVYIIDEVHMLTREAFNALLKTLEEPPAHAVFILATTEAHKVPDTIQSRTQRYNFKPIELGSVVGHLKNLAQKEQISIDDEALGLLASHGSGSFRDSINLLDQLAGMEGAIDKSAVERVLGIPSEAIIQDLLQALTEGHIDSLSALLKEASLSGLHASKVAQQLGQVLREQFLTNPQMRSLQLAQLLKQLATATAAQNDSYLQLELALFEYAMNRFGTEGVAPLAGPPAPPQSPLPTTPKTASVPTTSPVTEAPKQHTPEKTEKVPKPKADTEAAAAATPTEAKKAVDSEETASDTTAQAPTSTTPVASEEFWQAYLMAVKGHRNTLYGVLRMAMPLLEADVLTLAFSFAFHQKQCAQAANQKVLTDIASEVLGRPIQVTAILQSGAKPMPVQTTTASASIAPTPQVPPSDAPPALQDISSIFKGAELVD